MQEQFCALCDFSRMRENSRRVKIRTVREIRTVLENSSNANFSACAKLPASHFWLRMTPFCIFSNFTPDVITIDMGILVFHFFVRLYIAILGTVEGAGQGIDEKTMLCFWILPRLSFPLLFSNFLSNQTLP